MKKLVITLALATVCTVGYSQVTNTPSATAPASPLVSDLVKVVKDIAPQLDTQTAILYALSLIAASKAVRKYIPASKRGFVGALTSHTALIEPPSKPQTTITVGNPVPPTN